MSLKIYFHLDSSPRNFFFLCVVHIGSYRLIVNVLMVFSISEKLASFLSVVCSMLVVLIFVFGGLKKINSTLPRKMPYKAFG